MTIKTDITLPPLPVAVPWHKGYDRKGLESYARAAVEADRQGRMPSDEEIDKLSHGFALQYQDHVRGFARALLSRYSGGQPAAAPEHQRLREFYGVLTDRELIDAQQRHIEKLQAKLPASPSMATNRVREG